MGVSDPAGAVEPATGGRARRAVAAAVAFARRHWLSTALVVVALLVRAALPVVLRSVVQDQAQAAIRGQVEVGDVDLWLVLGGVALDDVAVRSEPGTEPLLGWKQLYVRISWLALARRTVLLRDVDLVRPRVDLERLADGELNLVRLLPESSAEPAAEEPPSAWRVGLDELTIAEGRLDFADTYVKGAKPIAVDVESLQVRGGGVGATGFEGPTTVAARLDVEGAPLRLDAELASGEAGIETKVRVDVQGLPVHSAVAYSPYGWEELRGRLDLAGEWDLGGGRSRGKGRVALRDVGVRIEGAEASGAEWSALEVEADAIDLAAREARIARIRWAAPKVAVEPGEPVPLPILRRVVTTAVVEPAAEAAREDAADAAPEPSAAPEQHAAPAKTAAPDENAAPEEDAASRKDEDGQAAWRWSVGTLDVEDMHVLASNGERRTEIGLSVHAESLADPSEKAGTIRFDVKPADGMLAGQGDVRIAPLEIRSALDWKDLDVAALVATVSRPELAGLRSARTSGRLEVRSTEDGGLALAGEVAAADLSYEGVAASVPRLAWKSLGVAIERIALPGVLAGAAASPAIELASVALDGARIQVERAAVESAGAPPAESTGAVTPEASAPADVSKAAPGADGAAAESGASAAGPQVTVGELTVTDSGIEVVDKSVGDPVHAEIGKIEVRARGLSWPSRRIEKLELAMDGPAGATVKLSGDAVPPSAAFALDVEGLELVPFDPYGREYGGVTIEGGTASLESAIDLSADRYETDSTLVLHDLALSGEEGERSFQARFGVPLGLALALLRDVSGDITLDLPVSGGREGVGVGFGKAVATTMQRVLVNALASPLKLIGSVALAGGGISGFDVEPIPFAVASAEPAPEAAERVDALGKLLAERPEVAVELEGRLARADLRSLREAGAAAALADPDSAASKALATLDDASAESVRSYLEADRDGGEAPADRPAALAGVLAKIEVTRDRLVNLGLERAERARGLLAARPGVAPEQLHVRTGTGEARAKSPGVIVRMGAR
jgi:hypothetical protein